ncbi:hypothetical protein BB561_006666 [Smittium simulii]|uniref:Uncharacterized protein n=1 Tax=Smittium simulii TaxID=133385 RepID=A0A2T9Y2Q7_9FUNG|nr:hypothetical protein BB561_006666 [Smittium simulii]
MFNFNNINEPINGFQLIGSSIRLVDHWDSQPAKDARDFYEKEIPKNRNPIVMCRKCQRHVSQKEKLINYNNTLKPTFRMFGQPSKRHVNQEKVHKEPKKVKLFMDYKKPPPPAPSKTVAATETLLGYTKNNILKTVIISGFDTKYVKESNFFLRNHVQEMQLETFKRRVEKIKAIKIITQTEIPISSLAKLDLLNLDSDNLL